MYPFTGTVKVYIPALKAKTVLSNIDKFLEKNSSLPFNHPDKINIQFNNVQSIYDYISNMDLKFKNINSIQHEIYLN